MPALKNAKHEAALQAYIGSKDRVGWKAYKRVYRKSSQRAAEVGWSRLLKNAEVSARLAELEAAIVRKVVEDTGITKEKVIAELAAIGFANLQDVVAVFEDGDLSTLTRAQAAQISELVVDTYMDGRGDDAREVRRVRLKLWDKRAALVDIGRELGMFKARHEITGKDGGPVEVTDPVDKPSELEVARRIAFLLERAGRSAAKSKLKGAA